MRVGALVAKKAHAIESRFGKKRVLLLLVILPVVGYVFLGAHIAKWSVVFIGLFYVARGMNNPIMKSYINGLVTSDERAKILSVQSAIGRLMFTILDQLWVG